jgi:hypothetical protein
VRPVNAATVQPSPVQQLLLQLQWQYGNRYVQRMLALTKQGEGELVSAGRQNVAAILPQQHLLCNGPVRTVSGYLSAMVAVSRLG